MASVRIYAQGAGVALAECYLIGDTWRMTDWVRDGSATLSWLTSELASSYIVFLAEPDEGASFLGWATDFNEYGEPIITGKDNPKTMLASSSMRAQHAIFSIPVVTYQLTTEISGSGSVSGSGTYAAGEAVVLIAEPLGGWRVAGWLVNGVDQGSTATDLVVVMNSDVTVQVIFEQIPGITYTLNISIVGNGNVTDAAGTYNSGDIVTLEAVADSGWKLSRWLVNGIDLGSEPSIDIVMDENKTVTVNFVRVYTYTVTTNKIGSGSITGGGTFNGGTLITLNAVPDTGWVISDWEEDGVSLGLTTSNIEVIADKDKTITVIFVESTVEQYTLTTEVSGNGSISEGGTFNAGAELEITAIPGEGWRVLKWTVNGTDQSTTESSINVVMNSDLNVIVTFEEIPVGNQYALTITITPSAGGTVTKVPDKELYDSGEEVVLVASPNTGYEFYGWAGSIDGNTLSSNVIMDNSKSVVAIFTESGNPVVPSNWKPIAIGAAIVAGIIILRR